MTIIKTQCDKLVQNTCAIKNRRMRSIDHMEYSGQDDASCDGTPPVNRPLRTCRVDRHAYRYQDKSALVRNNVDKPVISKRSESSVQRSGAEDAAANDKSKQL